MIYVDILCVSNALFAIVNPICCYLGNIVAFCTNEKPNKTLFPFCRPIGGLLYDFRQNFDFFSLFLRWNLFHSLKTVCLVQMIDCMINLPTSTVYVMCMYKYCGAGGWSVNGNCNEIKIKDNDRRHRPLSDPIHDYILHGLERHIINIWKTKRHRFMWFNCSTVGHRGALKNAESIVFF